MFANSCYKKVKMALLPSILNKSLPPLYSFASHTFTNATATGSFGPTLTQVRSAYSSTTWAATFLNMTTQGYQLWTVPASGTYTITCAGAGGGGATASFGCGRIVRTTVSLDRGAVIQIVVGQLGIAAGTGSSGGGGGSFVASGTTPATGVCLVAAGGGGGFLNASTSTYGNQNGNIGTSGFPSSDNTGTGGTNGNGGTGSFGGWGGGGGGFLTNGTAASEAAGYSYSGLGSAFVNGCAGGDTATTARGGFGGGAGTHGNTGGGGGGGGFSGGGGSAQSVSGATAGGGGSFPATGTTNVGLNRGHGYVTIAL